MRQRDYSLNQIPAFAIINKQKISHSFFYVNFFILRRFKIFRCFLSNSRIKRIALFSGLLFAAILTVSSQTVHSTWNNYTGNWMNPASWNPTWNTVSTSVNNSKIIINGYITCNEALTFSTVNDTMLINDTLIVTGDLRMGNSTTLLISKNGILIVRGNFYSVNMAMIKTDTNAVFAVTGDFIRAGSLTLGSFYSNSSPTGVYIGGSVDSSYIGALTYPVFDCPGSNPYDSSGCSYGNMADLLNGPASSFFESTCNPTTANAGADQSVCNNTTTKLAGNTPVIGTGLWSIVSGTGGTIVSPDDPKSKFNGKTGTTYVLRWTITDDPCTSTDDVSVSFNLLPVLQVSVTDNSGLVNNDGIICLGDSAILTASGGVTYSWSTGESGAEITKDTAGIYTVTVTDINGCINTADTLIVVNPLPVAGISVTDNSGNTNNDGILCAGDAAVLTASGGINYSWSTGETTAEITKDIAGRYTVTVTDANGCKSATDTLIVVNPLPVAGISVTDNSGNTNNDGILCAGDAAVLTASGGINYSWSTGETTTAIITNSAGSYSVVVTDANKCVNSAQSTVTIISMPKADAGTGSDICGPEYRLNALSGTGTGTWTVNSGTGNTVFSPDANDPSASVNVSSYGRYTFTWTVENEGCRSGSDVTVNFHEIPTANAGTDQELNNVFTTKMEAVLNPPMTGEWMVLSGSGVLDNSNSPDARVFGLSAGKNVFLWTVDNGFCSASDTMIIDVNDLFVPQVITPNNDNKNDFFVIKDIEKNSPVELVVYNRWGGEVYHNKDYTNNWDGKNNNGTVLPDDTYFYILKFADGRVKKGFVVIKR